MMSECWIYAFGLNNLGNQTIFFTVTLYYYPAITPSSTEGLIL